MEITTRDLEWSSDDQSNWQNFLNSQTGSRILPKLIEAAPVLLRGGQTNDILIKTGELIGFQEAVKGLLLLASPPATIPAPETHYPSLVDDKAWSDGQKIE